MKEQLQHMQRLQLAGALAGGIAHDLNDQLTLVIGGLDLALDRTHHSDKTFDTLELARNAAGRCADMSRRLQDLGRQKRKMERVDLGEVAEEAQRMLDYVKPINTYSTLAAEPGVYILGYPDEILQLFINLGMNGFQAMKGPGRIDIGVVKWDDKARMSVYDNGKGIPKSISRKIFQPFFTTRAETGAGGLGLTSVKAIVLEHAGHITVNSRPDRGTAFIIDFPAWRPLETEDETPLETESATECDEELEL
jgi:signal transduction histidine kinase